jgi:hypothetical protein
VAAICEHRPVSWRGLHLAAFAALGLAGAVAAPAAAATAEECAHPYSWVAGTTDLCAGTLAYHDYVYDDGGADTLGAAGPVAVATSSQLAPLSGDERYATDVSSADLVDLTLKPQGSQLLVSAHLNALRDPRSTVLAVAIDSDNNPATGGGQWGSLDVRSAGWDRIAFFDTGDPATNRISGTMPLPPGTAWRVQAATAIRSTGHVMNVAFRGPNEQARNPVDPTKGSWFEDLQAAALKTGDISQFGFQVDVTALTGGATRVQPVGPGLHSRVYTSKYTLGDGEGLTYSPIPGRGGRDASGQGLLAQAFALLGRFQPYAIYLPKGAGPHGLQMVYHGTSANMTSQVNQAGFQDRFGDGSDRILAAPEARGPDGFGSDISERDMLDVMADVEANYPVDRDRVFASGYSQGGYVSYRMAMLYPDLFAGLVNWVGFTGDSGNNPVGPPPLKFAGGGAVGNVIDLVGNLRRVPTTMLVSGADELVMLPTTTAMDQAFQRTDDVYRWYLHPAAEHLTYIPLDDWHKEAASTKRLLRVVDPPRVTFRTASFMDDLAHEIRHDRAYWVSDIRQRSASAYADVDLTSAGCGGTVPVTQRASDAGVDPVPWTSDERRQTGLRALPKVAKLSGTLTNVASLTIDTRATCLPGAFAYELTTDGPVAIRTADGRTVATTGTGVQKGVIAAPPVARLRVSVDFPGGVRRHLVGRRLFAHVHVRGGTVRSLQLVLRNARGRLLGRSGLATVSRYLHDPIRLTRALPAGRIRLTLSAKRPDGSRLTATFRFRVPAARRR